ncbi:50S ribosomal protein L11 [Candidatus Poribacteria bacterium]|nr:50S ribosomal protein L11 [Candidatus Poribacteria bacterium]MYF54252.1 50S ribosomal protein L11 [Candidatus Poribacteria bacterium]MYI92725.1 50S ribosomal protein L11 [Candidatus Poribacteria bacterium]
MAKQVAGEVKLQLVSGQATPQPPVGPSLAPYMINLQEFIKSFNAQTQQQSGMVVTTIITCYSDRSFTFTVKSPPAAVLLKSAAKIAKGSGEPNRNKVAAVTSNQIREIAETKLPDLNTNDIEAAVRMIEGTARSMGLTIN